MTDSIKTRLEKEWDLDEGFLGRLRMRVFDQEAHRRLLEILSQIPASPTLDRDLVRLIWYIPVFLEWNKEQVVSISNVDETTYERAGNALLGEIERILGLP
ncbi:hypothetical protein IV102_27550 [bacterium]|nr:hypothetical protein [bacterium]